MPSHNRPSQTSFWLVSLAASVGIHAPAIFLVAYFVRQPAREMSQALAKMVAPEPPSLTVLTPMLEAFRESEAPAAANLPEDRAVQQGKPAQTSGFLDTSAAQESSEAPAATPYHGERNTRASSSAQASDGAPSRPALDGREITPVRPLSTLESHARDGEIEHSSNGGNPVAQASPTGTTPVDRPQFEADQTPAFKPPATPVPDQAEQPNPSSGALTEAEKTKVDGSIDKDGIGSEDVIATPEGRYEAALKRAIDSHWQVIRAKNQQYMAPGMARVRLEIEASGKIHKIDFVNEFGTTKIQKGLLISSIRETKLPPMPPDVLKKLPGSFFDASISFYFSSQ